jgi:hypothetical protein
MALTISERRYRTIRAGVEQRRAETEATKVPWEKEPQSAEAFMAYLDTLAPPREPAPRSRRKRRSSAAKCHADPG